MENQVKKLIDHLDKIRQDLFKDAEMPDSSEIERTRSMAIAYGLNISVEEIKNYLTPVKKSKPGSVPRMENPPPPPPPLPSNLGEYVQDKDVIISGPPASGKSWISYAMEFTHRGKGFRVFGKGLIKKLLKSDEAVIEEMKNSPMVIVEECSANDIENIDLLMQKVRVNNYIPIIYLTQDKVSEKLFPYDNFHIIHIKNCYF